MSGIPSWARVGAKVVCVSTDGLNYRNGLVEGGQYNIRWVGYFDHPTEGTHLCVRLVGVTREFCGFDFPVGLYRFRPLVPIEDDISTHFEALLRVPQLEDAL